MQRIDDRKKLQVLEKKIKKLKKKSFQLIFAGKVFKTVSENGL